MSEKKQKKQMSEKAKTAACVILAFLLALVLFILSVSLIITCTVFSEAYINNLFLSVDYYESAKNVLEKNMVDLVLERGLEREIIDECVNFETFSQNIAEEVGTMFKKPSAKLNTDKFEEELLRNLKEYFTSQGYENIDEYEEGLVILRDSLAELYVNSVKQVYAASYRNIRTAYQPVMYILSGASVFALALLIFAVMRMHARRYLGCFYITVSLYSAALCCAVPPLVILITNLPYRIGIMPKYLNNLIAGLINGVSSAFAISALIAAAIATVMLLIYIRKRRDFHNKIKGIITN